jgi:hypothetical protein
LINFISGFFVLLFMRKKILTPEECEKLIPHWPELEERKIKKLLRMSTKKTSFGNGKNVMSPVGIVIMEDGYILNGKHRAVIGAWRKYNLEAYVVDGEHDIYYHLPHKTYGEVGVEGLVEALDKKDFFVNFCKNDGVRSVHDLIKKYSPILYN